MNVINRIRHKEKHAEEIKENIDYRAQIAMARRISQEMRSLAGDLITKAESLERELDNE